MARGELARAADSLAGPGAGVERAIDRLLADFPQLFSGLDYLGVGLFALTGALVAARARQDLVTAIFFAVFTGVGGGTIRDLVIGAPVFWIARGGYLEVCVAAALIVFALGSARLPDRLLLWADALGLSVYSVVGALKAQSYDVPALAAVAMGVLTATAGGILRDVVAMRPSVLLGRELYVTAAIAGAGLLVLLTELGVAHRLAAMLGFLLAFGVRAGALRYGWQTRTLR